jgi:hypothetical protein
VVRAPCLREIMTFRLLRESPGHSAKEGATDGTFIQRIHRLSPDGSAPTSSQRARPCASHSKPNHMLKL